MRRNKLTKPKCVPEAVMKRWGKKNNNKHPAHTCTSFYQALLAQNVFGFETENSA